MKPQLINANDLASVADELGKARALAAQAKDNVKFLENILKDSGEKVVEGSFFRVAVSRSERENVNWKAIAAKFNPSRQLVQAYRKMVPVVSVRVSALEK